MIKAKNGLNTPKDMVGNHMQLTIPSVALSTTIDDSIVSATSVTLQEETTLIEVTAKVGGVFLKYSAGVTKVSNGQDEYIEAGQTRHYSIPKDVTVISVIEDESGAGVRIIEK